MSSPRPRDAPGPQNRRMRPARSLPVPPRERALIDPVQQVAAWGGVVRTPRLAAAGVRRGEVERALARGLLIRPRRGWVAGADADPELVSAARHGVVLTCVTRARRAGLWVLREDGPHVAAPAHAGRAPTRTAVVHWGRPMLPRHPDALEDSLPDALALAAGCLPREEALVLVESALRTGAVDRDELERMPLPPRLAALLLDADPFADSGLETLAVPRLRWIGLPLRRQVWLCGHRVDLLIGERLVLQIDGATHTGAQRDSDNRHDAELALRGFHVIRVGYRQIVDEWPAVQEAVMRAVAQGLHRAR